MLSKHNKAGIAKFFNPECDTTKRDSTWVPLTLSNNQLTCIEEVLNGAIESLWRAFSWTETPQGYDYWNKIADGYNPLTDEARAYMVYQLEVNNA